MWRVHIMSCWVSVGPSCLLLQSFCHTLTLSDKLLRLKFCIWRLQSTYFVYVWVFPFSKFLDYDEISIILYIKDKPAPVFGVFSIEAFEMVTFWGSCLLKETFHYVVTAEWWQWMPSKLKFNISGIWPSFHFSSPPIASTVISHRKNGQKKRKHDKIGLNITYCIY